MFDKVFTVAVICGVWMSLAMALAADSIVDLIAGSQGRGAVSVLRIQGLMLFTNFVSTASALALISLHRHRAMVITSLSALALNILLALVLVPPLGARGGAVADAATGGVVAVGLTALLTRTAPQHRITASVVPPLILACTLSASVLLLPIDSVARAIAATVIYFGVLFITRAIPAEVTAAVRRIRAPSALPWGSG
jgi:O-antigen/teichoic acid export membrane protein